MLLVTEKSAVPILTGKEPASNPVLTTGSPVTEVSRLQRIDGHKLVGQEVFFSKIPLTNQLQSLPTEWRFTQPPILWLQSLFPEPTGLTGYRACWLQRKAAERPLWTGRRQLYEPIPAKK